MRALLLIATALILLSHGFIDLEWAVDLGRWHMNAPVADLAATALLPLGVALAWRARLPLPGWRGYALFLVAAGVSVGAASVPGEALHHLLRKPIFLYLAYGVSLAAVVSRLGLRGGLTLAILGFSALTASVSLATSVERIGAGDALWFQSLAGLTPNHKTLAVALSAWVPLLLWLAEADAPPRLRAACRGALALTLAAVLASASKTAWITAAFGLAWRFPRARPLGARPRLILPALALSLGLALYAPLLLRSKTMLDAARSRHSLNVRAAEMFSAHPLFGSGTGMNVLHDMVTFPHYRVNGVDAHGVIQKIGSETGLVGLMGYLGFVAAMGLALRARAREGGDASLERALFGVFLALHLNLLLSTETFSPTHWAPLALCWGLAHRARSAP